MSLIEKIDAEIDNRYNKSDDFFKLVVNTNIITGLQLAKEIILSEQKKQEYIHSCLTCLNNRNCTDNTFATLTCDKYILDREYKPIKTKGDVIRESNESLAEWYAEKTNNVLEQLGIGWRAEKEKVLDRLNQPQEDTNATK